MGTTSWTDPTLIEASWYPAEDTFARLRFVRNRVGYDTTHGLHPAASRPSRRWPHRGLDLAATARTRAHARAKRQQP